MAKTMRAAVYYGIDDMRVEDRPIAEIDSDEVLLRTLACGLCGGEAMPWYKKSDGKVLGHEPIAEVVSCGVEIDTFKPGDRLFVHHHVANLTSTGRSEGTTRAIHISRKPTSTPVAYASTSR